MFNPASSETPDPPATEWVELFNPTYSDIAIGGWYFQDEDPIDDDPCVPARSGSIPDFVLHPGNTVVILPDGPAGNSPAVTDFKTAWNRPAIDVLQLLPNGTARGGIVGGGLANDPRNDGIAANDLPLEQPEYRPCHASGPERPDNEILVLRNPAQIIDVVNLDDSAPWPEDTGYSSITLVPGDYPAAHDLSTYSAGGNDLGVNWRSHESGDAAGGFVQHVAAGIYNGHDIGSPGFLLGATAGNQPPVAVSAAVAMAPGESPCSSDPETSPVKLCDFCSARIEDCATRSASTAALAGIESQNRPRPISIRRNATARAQRLGGRSHDDTSRRSDTWEIGAI